MRSAAALAFLLFSSGAALADSAIHQLQTGSPTPSSLLIMDQPNPPPGTGWTTKSLSVAALTGGMNVTCDGVMGPPAKGTDNTAAINAALAAAGQYTKLILPAGICLFSGTLNAGALQHVDIGGAGKNATVLLYDGASTTNDLFYVGGTTGPGGANYVSIHDLSILSATTMTAGSALHCQFCTYVWIQNFDLDAYNGAKTIWDGIWADQPGWITVRDYILRMAQDDDARVSGGSLTGGWNYDVFFLGGKIGAAGHAGFHIGGGMDAVHLWQSEITHNNIGVLVDHNIVAYKNQEWDVDGNYIDFSATSNVVIDDSLCNTTNLGVGHLGGRIALAENGPNILIKNWPTCELVIDAALITSANPGSVGDGIAIQDQSTILSVSPKTIITANARYGISSTLPDGTTAAEFDNLYSVGQIFSNAGGATDANVSWTKVGKGPASQIFIGSGFGTNPSISSGYSTQAFVVNVGTGGSAYSGVIGMPLATSGWMCKFNDALQHTAEAIQTGNTQSSVTVTNYSFTTGATQAWGSGDTLAAQCAPR